PITFQGYVALRDLPAFPTRRSSDLVLGDAEVIDHIKHRARSFLFSASLPVPIVAAATTILEMLEQDGPALVAELHQKAEYFRGRSEEHTSELQSRENLVCRLLLEKK